MSNSGQFSTSERRAINQFAGFTDTNSRIAVQYLVKSGWDIQRAINDYYSSSNSKKNINTKPNDNNNNNNKIKTELIKIFNKFKDPDNPNIIGIDGSIEFIQSLQLNVEDSRVLAVAFQLNAKQMGEFNLDGFINGWLKLDCDSIEKMIIAVESKLGPDMMNNTLVFKNIYKFTFDFVKPPQQRSMPFDTAIDYWRLLLHQDDDDENKKTGRFILLDKWIQFLFDSPSYREKSITRDCWNMLLEFAQYSNNDIELKSYDDEAAWPSILDEFVMYIKS